MSAEERRNALAAMPEVWISEIFREKPSVKWKVSESGFWLVEIYMAKDYDESQL